MGRQRRVRPAGFPDRDVTSVRRGAIGALPPLAAIFGTGRSGTTWLGSIVNAHPRVAYRFEPFHRHKGDRVLRTLRRRFENGECADEDLQRLYDRLRRAEPLTDKPPFFTKDNVLNPGRETAWICARACPPLRPAFTWLYSPQGSPRIVFKEVTLEPVMRTLLRTTQLPTVYLVRHPCATVASVVRGQTEGNMPTGRIDVLQSLLRRHDDELHERYGHRLRELDPYEQNALLWRIDVECAVHAIEEAGRGLLLTFEQLCDDAYAQVARVCRELDIDFNEPMVQFLDGLYVMGSACSKPSRGRRDRYFTVFRNPREQRDRWKKTLSSEARLKIERIVQPSSAFERCAAIGGWCA